MPVCRWLEGSVGFAGGCRANCFRVRLGSRVWEVGPAGALEAPRSDPMIHFVFL